MGIEAQQRMRKAQQKLRLRGVTLTVDALKAVVSFLHTYPLPDDEALEQISQEIDKLSLKSNILSKEAIQAVLASLTGSSYNDQNVLHIIDAFEVPRLTYDPIRKLFYRCSENLPIHGDAQSKASLYRDRLQLLHQRLIRDKHFAKPAFNFESNRAGSCEMTPLQSLIGCTGKRWVMGVISQLEDGRFFLEDLTASIPVDLTQAKITTGLFVENTVIVAEGELQPNGTFQVLTCGFPPMETRAVSLTVTAGLDFFGGGAIAAEQRLRLEKLERKAVNDMFVILSDIWLDNAETLEKLTTIFDGYEAVDVVPSLFVFMGNFCSHPCNLAFHDFTGLRSQFNKLGLIIAAHSRIKEQSKFLFIPGPEDLGPANILPRPALPKILSKELQQHLPNAIFSSNPCRIRYYSQEIVLFRQDLLFRMRRLCVLPPSEEETSDPFEHLVVTIAHQSHLCPLPLTKQPISWNHDHALRLYPTPHTVVLADSSEQKVFKYSGLTCINPGSFANDGTFIAYRPSTGEAELSAI
ncbi:hypothetical protein L7F22_069375 [Adiantum nelumboides]|nr:hypothetical protein [Adiantum nelumboides]